MACGYWRCWWVASVKAQSGTSLVVQGLRLHASMAEGARVPPLVRKLRPHMLCGQRKAQSHALGKPGGPQSPLMRSTGPPTTFSRDCGIKWAPAVTALPALRIIQASQQHPPTQSPHHESLPPTAPGSPCPSVPQVPQRPAASFFPEL